MTKYSGRFNLMKRSTLIAICLVLALSSGIVFATVKHFAHNAPHLEIIEVNPTIIVEDEEVDFRELYGRPILNVQGRTMLPLRAFAYHVMGIDPKEVTKENEVVFYKGKANNPEIRPDGESINHIYIKAKDRRVDFWEGFNYIWIQKGGNKYVVKTDVPPIIMDEGHTYLPFRAQAYALGYNVEYDEDTRTIKIFGNGPDLARGGIEGVFETVEGYDIMNTKRGSLQGQGKEEIFPPKWKVGEENKLITQQPQKPIQSGKNESKIPYQKFINNGTIKENKYAKKIDFNPDYKEYVLPEGRAREILKLAYNPVLKNSGRLIIARGILHDTDNPYEDGFIVDWGPLSKLESNENWDSYWGSFDLNSPRTWGRLLQGTTPFEIMSVNGVPWQDTPYKDAIIEATLNPAISDELGNPDILRNDPYYRNIYLDKKQNGFTPDRLYYRQGDLFAIWVGKTKAEMWKGWKLAETTQLPAKPYKDGNHVMVPLKPLMKYIGVNSSVSANGNNIIVKDKGHTYVFTLNSNKAKIDGKDVTISKPLCQKGGHTFISLNVVRENLNRAVNLDTDGSWIISVAVEGMWSN